MRFDLTARRVMTMRWMEGERPSDLMAAALGGVEGTQNQMAAKNKLLRLVLLETPGGGRGAGGGGEKGCVCV